MNSAFSLSFSFPEKDISTTCFRYWSFLGEPSFTHCSNVNSKSCPLFCHNCRPLLRSQDVVPIKKSAHSTFWQWVSFFVLVDRRWVSLASRGLLARLNRADISLEHLFYTSSKFWGEHCNAWKGSYAQLPRILLRLLAALNSKNNDHISLAPYVQVCD